MYLVMYAVRVTTQGSLRSWPPFVLDPKSFGIDQTHLNDTARGAVVAHFERKEVSQTSKPSPETRCTSNCHRRRSELSRPTASFWQSPTHNRYPSRHSSRRTPPLRSVPTVPNNNSTSFTSSCSVNRNLRLNEAKRLVHVNCHFTSTGPRMAYSRRASVSFASITDK